MCAPVINGPNDEVERRGIALRQTKLLYPNHRLPPWPNEDATRDRSNRLLDVIGVEL
jgi:hypothetical protein